MNKVDSHYNEKAREYDHFRQSGLVGYLVRKEQELIFKQLKLQDGEEILDAGCGSGIYADKIASLKAKPIGVDISPEMVRIYRKKGYEAHEGDLTTFDLEKKFLKILCAGPLEFVPDQTKLFSNLVRHLESGGEMYCLFPRKNLFGFLYKFYHLLNKISIFLYSRKNIQSIGEEHHLKIIFQENPDPLTTWVVFKKI